MSCSIWLDGALQIVDDLQSSILRIEQLATVKAIIVVDSTMCAS